MLKPIITRRPGIPVQPTGIPDRRPIPAPAKPPPDQPKVVRQPAMTRFPVQRRPVVRRYDPPVATSTLPGITIRRWAANGDVIAATSVARLLNERGFQVRMVAAPSCSTSLIHSPHLHAVLHGGHAQIDLDGAYENHPEKKLRSIPELMISYASEQLVRRGMPPLKAQNYANLLKVMPDEQSVVLKRFRGHPRPWVVISPNSFRPARTVPPEIFGRMKDVRGTLFWASNIAAPDGVHNLHITTLRELLCAMSLADLALVSESAPLHVAAGFKRPTICFRMSTDPTIRVSHQRDVLSYGTNLECQPCGEYVCRIDPERPPCAAISSIELEQVINHRLNPKRVSAIIPVYSPDLHRLTRCLNSVVPQVDEVIISLDGEAELPHGLPMHKVKICRHLIRRRMGYGKTCNRGVLASSGEFLLFLNDDCYLEPNAVTLMMAQMREQVAVVGCQQRYPDGRIYFGGAIRTPTGFGHFDHLKTVPQITNPAPQEFINFAAALVRRKAFYSVDAFDERYDCYCEDADLCLRLARSGWGLVYEPNARAIHEESMTTGPMKQKLLTDGVAIFNEIWLPHFSANSRRQHQVFS
jgi:hypothetical protein